MFHLRSPPTQFPLFLKFSTSRVHLLQFHFALMTGIDYLCSVKLYNVYIMFYMCICVSVCMSRNAFLSITEDIATYIPSLSLHLC